MLGIFSRGKNQERRTLAEDAFLAHHLKPRSAPSKHAQEEWEDSLGKAYQRVIRDFVKSGALRRPTVREALQTARVKDIKPVLRELDLKVSGRKAELIERLIESAPDAAMKLATEHAHGVYVVTDAGRERALGFEEEQRRRRQEAEQRVREALKSGNVGAACDAVNEFYRWLPANLRPGIGMDWENPERGVHGYAGRVEYILEDAPESWVVKDLPTELRETMIFHAAQDELWPGEVPRQTLDMLDRRAEELGESIDSSSRLRAIQVWAHSAEISEQQRKLRGTRVWKTAADEHVCEICAPLDEAPEQHWNDRFPHGPPAHHACRCGTGLTWLDDAQLKESYRNRQNELRRAIKGWGTGG